MEKKSEEKSLEESLPFRTAASYYPFFLNAGLLPSPYANISTFAPIYTSQHTLPNGSIAQDGQFGVYAGINSGYDYASDRTYFNPNIGASYNTPLLGGSFYANATAALNQRPSFGIGWRATF